MNDSLSTISKILKREVPRLRTEYYVESLGVFGSYLRHEQGPNSDLDLLVTFSEPPTLLQFVRLKNEISDLLGIPVDLVMRSALKPRIGEEVLREVVAIS